MFPRAVVIVEVADGARVEVNAVGVDEAIVEDVGAVANVMAIAGATEVLATAPPPLK
jgi:hypothetical protein